MTDTIISQETLDRAFEQGLFPRPRMMVWLAWEGTLSDRLLLGVFSSRGRAVRAWAMHYVPEPGWSTITPGPPLWIALDNPDVEEAELDALCEV